MDENLLETNSIYNNNNNAKINNTTTSMNNNTLLNANINKNNTKLIEFIHDLKEAIQNGEFQTNNNNNYSNNQHYLHHQQHQQQEQQQQYETINHVNNLSNQTFNYIINWLKQQQFQIDENKVCYLKIIHLKAKKKLKKKIQIFFFRTQVIIEKARVISN